jgi:23S rRNA (adenine2030-N6)-methyltransferase
LNYRHAFHAGNFADVLKHVLLASTVVHLRRKPGAFRYLDTHAGIGVYDLGGTEAARTGEWRDGIGRLQTAPLSPALRALLQPYLELTAGFGQAGAAPVYPGSPEIVRALSREHDRLVLCELHPDDAAALAARYAGLRRVTVLALDGWLALKAQLPPPERRGLVLVDPPFELAGDYDRLVRGLVAAYRRWPTGSYLLWYPIKDIAAYARFRAAIGATAIADMVAAEIRVRAPAAIPSLHGCGVILVNPPWDLPDRLGAVLPELAAVLAQGPGAAGTVERITGEG